MRAVENYEISLVKEPKPPQDDKLFLTFDMTDLPNLPKSAIAASLSVDKEGFGALRVSFEDTKGMEDVLFPKCPPGLVEVIRSFDWLGVVGLSPDGAKIELFSSVVLTKNQEG